MRQVSRTIYAVAAIVMLLRATGALSAELAPHVIAQVDESGGYHHAPKPRVRAVRVFVDGRIEALDDGVWTEIGRLSEAAVLRFKATTDVMLSTSRLITSRGVPDAALIEYSVRNGGGEVVLVGTAGPQDARLMQGGAIFIIRVLEGLRALAWISH